MVNGMATVCPATTGGESESVCLLNEARFAFVEHCRRRSCFVEE